MKAESKTFKGIKFVQLSELPADQQTVLIQTLDKNNFIKILIGGKITHNCIQYKDYDHWFENVFIYYRSRKIHAENTTAEIIVPNVAFAK